MKTPAGLVKKQVYLRTGDVDLLRQAQERIEAKTGRPPSESAVLRACLRKVVTSEALTPNQRNK